MAGSGGSPNNSYFGDRNLVMKRAKTKEAEEREIVRFSLAKLHPYVEAIGCLVTYAEDEIAHSPRLNAFSLTCDLHTIDHSQAEAEAQALAAGGGRFAFNPGDQLRLLEGAHNPKTLPRHSNKPNVVVVCKLFRRHGDHRDWAFHSVWSRRSCVVVRSAVTAALVEAMQVFLLDLMPDIEIPNRNALSSVAGICAALSCDEFLGIECHFPEEGLRKDEFARLLLFEILRSRPELQRRLGRARDLVGLLFEMFEQIDINGDAVVDWEEFTTFCVALGATFPQLKRLAVIEHKSSRILMYDLDVNFLHELNCSEKLAAEKKTGDKQVDALDTLEVLDAEHVPARNALAVASNDLCISLWSIIDATVGSYVFNGKLVGRFPALFVKWCPPPLKRLFVAGGSTEQVQLWDLEVPMHAGAAPPPPPMLLPRHHSERLADCLDLPDTPYVATASFDHTITLWEAAAGTSSSVGGPSAVLKVAFVLRGHQQAVLTLDYAHSLLLSSGFEYQAYCWAVSGRTLKTKLGGHHHCLMGAKFVSTASNGPCLAITGDQSGHFKLWDITRCAKGLSGSHLAVMLQTFELHTPNLCRFRMFVATMGGGGNGSAPGADKQESLQQSGAHANSESPACDIITGNLRLYRFRAASQSVATAQEGGAGVEDGVGVPPTQCVVFNSVANTFVGAVENQITVWNANSGAKIEEPVLIRDAEVCAIVFDSPRERKLFVATSVHKLQCLISTGDDRALCVLDSPAGKSRLELIHSVEKAHNSSITCCACSPPQSSPSETDPHTSKLVATADDAGGVHVYDLRRLTLLFRCADRHTREVRALHFPAAAPALLISGDAAGSIFIWPTTGVRRDIALPLMQLVLHEPSPLHGVPAPSKAEVEGVTSICSSTVSQDPQTPAQPTMLYAGTESGRILTWDLRTLAHKVQRGHHLTRHFEGRRLYPALSKPSDDVFHDGDTTSGIAGTAARRNGINAARPKATLDSNNTSFDAQNQRNVSIVAAAVAAATEVAETIAPVPVCPPMRSWMAHLSAVLSVQSMPSPGELFSFSADGALKVWDAAFACVGHIPSTGAANQTKPSAWKFVRRDHAGGDAEKRLHQRIATEVIAKHHRLLKRQARQHQKTRHHRHRSQQQKDEAVSATTTTAVAHAPSLEPELPLEAPREAHQSDSTPPTTASSSVIANAAASLLAQVPFSVTSVKDGILQGLFGPEEAQQLRNIAKLTAESLATGATKEKRAAALAPLFPSAEELARTRAKAKTKARAAMPGGQQAAQLAMAGARTLTNYPLELERRASTSSASEAAAQRALDVEPSPFLREKLRSAASPTRQAAKSTPKKRPSQPSPLHPVGLDIRMDASVVVLARNVSLPKLVRLSITSEEGDEPTSPLPATQLSSSASAPMLTKTRTSPALDSPPSSHEDACRENIARKMKLCEKIVASVCLMTSSPKKRKQGLDKPSPDSPTAGARRARPMVQLAPGVNPFRPHYTVKQVEEFAVVLARLDEDGSGDLDQREWTKLLQRCGLTGGSGSANTSAESVERLFHSLDRDSSGTISVRELLPTVVS
ncbi:hypothetical protein BBJ28_00014335 [Nothophytophthora sp. Chile5]|nr:hypothetical protein BBJ28_00014335 [Nothophytophthora sp. Chile5]